MSNLTGTDKSVILLMTIGEDRAAEVFKHLSQREVQTLSAAMANVTQISNKQLTDVLAEFEQEAEQFAALNINANDYLRSVLVKALGEERAASLLEDILETRDTASGIETLNFMEPQSAADLIRDEHPQIIATILVHLKRAQAADIPYGISANKLPGITIFCIWSPFRAGIHNRVGCHCAGFDGLPALLINDGTRCNPAFMYPLLTAVQSGIHCLPLKALSASGTDNRV